jgi:hypothetical protein
MSDMTTTPHDIYLSGTRRGVPAGVRWGLILSAIGFVLLYLSVDVVTANLASSSPPLPNAPAEEARMWFAENGLAAVMIGVCQLLSVACLAGFVVALRRAAVTVVQVAANGRARPWGLGAAALMGLCSVLSWLLVVLAPTASLDTVSLLSTGSFITGGTAHVLALGVFVVLASRMPGFGKAVRVLGIVAVVPAVASLVSLVWFQGAALILLGRLLCMMWTVSAAVSVAKRTRQ